MIDPATDKVFHFKPGAFKDRAVKEVFSNASTALGIAAVLGVIGYVMFADHTPEQQPRLPSQIILTP